MGTGEAETQERKTFEKTKRGVEFIQAEWRGGGGGWVL